MVFFSTSFFFANYLKWFLPQQNLNIITLFTDSKKRTRNNQKKIITNVNAKKNWAKRKILWKNGRFKGNLLNGKFTKAISWRWCWNFKDLIKGLLYLTEVSLQCIPSKYPILVKLGQNSFDNHTRTVQFIQSVVSHRSDT